MLPFFVFPVVKVTLGELGSFDHMFPGQNTDGVKELLGVDFRQVFEFELVQQIISNQHGHITDTGPGG